MSIGRLMACGILLAVGYAMAGGLYWTLLNVPESSIPMLIASALLALALVTCAGVTTAAATALAQGASLREAFSSGLRALPLFVVGLLLFGLLWTLAGYVEQWWAGHRGEIDALSLRYLRTGRTQPIHAAVEWLLWLLQWGLGLSLVGGLTTAGSLGELARRTAAPAHPSDGVPRQPGVVSGVRAGLSWLPITVIGVGAVVFAEGLWRFAYWRPEGLPASTAEMVFVGAKLAALYVALIALTTTAIGVLGRTVRRLASL